MKLITHLTIFGILISAVTSYASRNKLDYTLPLSSIEKYCNDSNASDPQECTNVGITQPFEFGKYLACENSEACLQDKASKILEEKAALEEQIAVLDAKIGKISNKLSKSDFN